MVAIKPGNVSVALAAHRMSASDFTTSAFVTAPLLVKRYGSLGEVLEDCALSTKAAVGCNTNLGIIILCVPLARAALACETAARWRSTLIELLSQATIEDTQKLFNAIAILEPAGLGEVEEHDARHTATAPLLEVMRHGSSHDLIAQQYSNGFEEIFEFGKESYLRARVGSPKNERDDVHAVSVLFLDFLSEFPDTHIARKHGATMAEAVRDEARVKREVFNSLETRHAQLAFLVDYDQQLKNKGINPGTSADLTVATVFTQLLMSNTNVSD